MNVQKTTGLGEPDSIGKKSLFQPPSVSKSLPEEPEKKKLKPVPARARMTLEITKKSLAIMQEIQSTYRLETGRPLPKWKVIDEVFAAYEKIQKEEGSEKPK